VSQQVREDRGVVRDDAIGKQPAALAPQVLFIFRPESQLAEVGVRDGPVQLVVILPAVQGPLDVLTQRWGVDVLQEVEAADDVVVFPEGTPGLVLAGIRVELSHDDALGRRLEGQGDEDPLQVLPLLDDQMRVDLADGLEHQVRVLARVLEAVERGPDLVIEVPVPRRELIAKDVEEGEVDLVGAMGISRVHVRLNLGAVVEQEIEHVMALMLAPMIVALTGMWLATSV